MFQQERSHKPDPVLSDFPLPLRAMHYPLGFPLDLATNSEDVLRAAQESWGQFRQAFSEEPVRLHIGVYEGGEDESLPIPMVRAQRHLLVTMGGNHDFTACDLKKGFGFGWLASATAAHRAHFRYFYLEAMAYSVLQSLHLTPIHAACVALNGRGLLLCGDSEAGKSSLAYACARLGWTFISDDASYLLRGWKGNAVIGNPHVIRLRDSAPGLFPELRQYPVTLRAQGDRAIELTTSTEANVVTAPNSSINHVVFLNRQNSGPPRLLPFPKEKALRSFEKVLCFGERAVREAQVLSLQKLLTCNVVEFRYSDLDVAVAELKSLVACDERPGHVRLISAGWRENA